MPNQVYEVELIKKITESTKVYVSIPDFLMERYPLDNSGLQKYLEVVFNRSPGTMAKLLTKESVPATIPGIAVEQVVKISDEDLFIKDVGSEVIVIRQTQE